MVLDSLADSEKRTGKAAKFTDSTMIVLQNIPTRPHWQRHPVELSSMTCFRSPGVVFGSGQLQASLSHIGIGRVDSPSPEFIHMSQLCRKHI